MNCSTTANASLTDVEPFFDLASDLMCVLSMQGHCIRVNQAFAEAFDSSTQALRDRPLSALAHSDDREYVQACVARVAEGEPAIEFTRRFTQGSQVRWLNWTLSSKDISNQESTESRQICGVARDVTLNHLSQGELAQSSEPSLAASAQAEPAEASALPASTPASAAATQQEQSAQLRIMFDQANIGIARLSASGQWIQANRYLCDLLGYSADALTQKTFAEVIHPDDRAKAIALYQRLVSSFLSERKGLAKRFAQDEIESRYVSAAGDAIWTVTTPSAVYDAQGELLYLIAVVQDINRRKEALRSLKQEKDSLIIANSRLAYTMRSLEERNVELDQFAYVTSHDLRAPLRAISNLAAWIEEDLEGQLPAENVEQLNLLQSRVHRMEGLIDGLLAYSRVGRTHQSSELVDVVALVKAIFDALPTEGFRLAIAPDMPRFHAKKVLLSQVFSNLISNAIKHHHRREGLIKIGVQELEQAYQFSVTDDGPGIATAYHQKVFVIFQTLRARDDLESTGIGLSLVKKIVQGEGGTVQIVSEEGKGTTFLFTWPKIPSDLDPSKKALSSLATGRSAAV